MSSIQNGFLIIADISGYTAFLSHTELEPAAVQLQGLLDILIQNTKPPLLISRLEGDAVISYALEGSINRGETLVDIIENIYIAFRKALEFNMLNNACDCSACEFVPTLDLKFFVHYGSFILQPLITYTELIGTDVNLIHRLTKNTITEKTAIKAYVAYSKAAIYRLGVQDLYQELTYHTETYEHIGMVDIYVKDMHALWEQNQSLLRDLVNQEEALIELDQNFPCPPVVLWDFVTRPEFQAVIAGYKDPRVPPEPDQRMKLGATYRCLDKSAAKLFSITNWEPVEQYTVKANRLWNQTGRTTVNLRQSGNDTKLIVSVSKSTGGLSLVRGFYDQIFRMVGKRRFQQGISDLLVQIQSAVSQR